MEESEIRPILERRADSRCSGVIQGILKVDTSARHNQSRGSLLSDKLFPTLDVECVSPQSSVDSRLSVTFAREGNFPADSMDKVRFTGSQSTADNEKEGEEEEDYSASVSAILQRRASSRRQSCKRRRRPSSPFSPDIESSALGSRRRSSAFTTSSGDTVVSVEEGTSQEQIFQNIRLHKEVLSYVKYQPWPMRRKVRLVQQAKAYIKKHEGELQERIAHSKSTKDIVAHINILFINYWAYLKRELANLSNFLIPWELRIKEIESHFGSVVASYFTFLRWLFWVNLVIAIVLLTFVAVPELLIADPNKAVDRKIIPEGEERRKSRNLITLWNFEGVLKYSPLFYGFYTNLDGDNGSYVYRLPLGYFITGLAVYIYSFVAILRKFLKTAADFQLPKREKMAENSRQSKLSEKGDECVFTWKVFTGWDYMIGNGETSHNRTASIILGFKEVLLEEAEKIRDDGRNWKRLWLRICGHVSVLGLLVTSVYAVVYVVQRSTESEAQSSWWRQNEITVVVSLIGFIYPIIFDLHGLVERYHPRKALRLQLARIMALNLLNLFTFIFATFSKIDDIMRDSTDCGSENTSAPSLPTTISDRTSGQVSSPQSVRRVVRNVLLAAALLNSTGKTITTLKSAEPTRENDYGQQQAVNFAYDYEGIVQEPARAISFNDEQNTVNFNGTELLHTTSGTEKYTDMYFPSEESTGNLTGTVNATDFNVTDQSYTSLGTGNITEMYFPSEGNTEDFNATEQSYISQGTENYTEIYFPSEENTQDLNGTEQSYTSQGTVNYTEMYFSTEGSMENLTDSSTEVSYTKTKVYTPSEDTTQTSTSTSSDPASSTVFNDKELLTTRFYPEKQTEMYFSNEDSTGSSFPPTSFPVEVTSTSETQRIPDSCTGREKRSPCWETMFGQELIKLTIMDLILTIASILILDFFRAVFVRGMNGFWCWDLEKKFPQYGDFKIAENILHLVNNQGMVWMGMFFSPGLPLINLLKLAIIMYLRSWTVLTCNVPHEVVFKASRSNNFYLALLLTMLFLCVLPVGYAIVWVEPSKTCGPFSGSAKIYYIFTASLKAYIPTPFHKILDYVASPGIVIPLLMLLILIIYYLVSLTNALREANADLKIQLRRERTEERRKVFQLADKKHRGDADTPYTRWRKILPSIPTAKSSLDNTEDGVKPESGSRVESIATDNRGRDLIMRLMKRDLRKSSATSDEGFPGFDEDFAAIDRETSPKESGGGRSGGGRGRERTRPGGRESLGKSRERGDSVASARSVDVIPEIRISEIDGSEVRLVNSGSADTVIDLNLAAREPDLRRHRDRSSVRTREPDPYAHEDTEMEDSIESEGEVYDSIADSIKEIHKLTRLPHKNNAPEDDKAINE